MANLHQHLKTQPTVPSDLLSPITTQLPLQLEESDSLLAV